MQKKSTGIKVTSVNKPDPVLAAKALFPLIISMLKKQGKLPPDSIR